MTTVTPIGRSVRCYRRILLNIQCELHFAVVSKGIAESCATYTHTRPINRSSATLTGPTLGMRNGPAHEARLSTDAWKGHVTSHMVNRQWRREGLCRPGQRSVVSPLQPAIPILSELNKLKLNINLC